MKAVLLKTFITAFFLSLACATGTNAQVGWFLFGVAAGQSGSQQGGSSSTVITKNVGEMKLKVFYQRPDIANKIPERYRDSIRTVSKAIQSEGQTVQELFEEASREDLNRYPWHRPRFDVNDYVLLGAAMAPDPDSRRDRYTFWYVRRDILKK